jgi:methylaspartate ammonia-lyase
MKIQDVVYAVGRSGYFNKDLKATKAGAKVNGTILEGKPLTPGYTRIVQPGHIISVMLILEGGEIAIGECADVIFSGLAGRDPLFVPKEHLPVLESTVRSWFIGRDVTDFRANAEEIDQLQIEGRRLHTALRYGLTQSLLAATAVANRSTIAEVVSREYGSPIQSRVIDILASCHRGDLLQLDRMIIKRVPILPHASFTTAADLGEAGNVLVEYAGSIGKRVQEIGDADYRPRIHLDVYGTIGELFSNDINIIAEYLGRVASAVSPFEIMIETPIIASTREEQIELFQRLRAVLRERNISIGLVADEWCNTLEDIRIFADAGASDYVQIKTPDLGGVNNTIEAILYCKSKGMGCCLGGTANETDLSARICAQIGLATNPDFMLSKPGIGADEGVMILNNEMARTIALIERRKHQRAA